jgi:hypothetical protein
MVYDEVIKNLQTLLEIPLNQSDENFSRIIPLMFAYAENRIYRELDFLATTTMTTGVLTKDVTQVDLPVTVLILRQMSVLASTPTMVVPGGFVSDIPSRNVLERVSLESLDMFWPQLALPLGLPRIPRQFAIIGKPQAGPPQVFSYSVRIAPAPDKPYDAEYLGVIRPAPLSPSNTETLLSTIYPDLFCAACMVFASGYQRDFGAMADDPQKAMSWEGTYSALRMGAMMEAARQKGEGPGWTGVSPAPLAQPRAP